MSFERFKQVSQKIQSQGETAINSLRVAPQWFIPAALFGTLSLAEGYRGARNLQDGKVLRAIPYLVLSYLSFEASMLCNSVTKEYLNDYQKMKRIFSEKGWDKRVVAPHVDYYCGKRASRFAAIDSGYSTEFTEYLQSLPPVH